MNLTLPEAVSALAAAQPPAGRSLLRMAVADEVLAVPIEAVREILQVSRMTALPRTPPFVRGVMNLRGAVVPVFDLAARLGCGRTEIGKRSCIVIVECHAPPDSLAAEARAAAPLVLGLLVDAVFEVFDCHPGDIEPVPALGTRIRPEALQGMTRAKGAVIGVLALDRELAAAALAADIASHQAH